MNVFSSIRKTCSCQKYRFNFLMKFPRQYCQRELCFSVKHIINRFENLQQPICFKEITTFYITQRFVSWSGFNAEDSTAFPISPSKCNFSSFPFNLSIICITACEQSYVSSGSIVCILLNNLINERPTAHARFTGTALPICLYLSAMDPANCQLSGNVWILAYSLTVNGRVSSGWHRSVCFWHGEHVSVNDGSSKDKRRAIPVLPPPKSQLPPIYSLATSSGRLRQSPP